MQKFEDTCRGDLEKLLYESEQRLNTAAVGKDEADYLFHNLQMHQIELEIQNLDLRESQQALEEARDRFADLYDFAPVGYLALDGKGIIREINLTACSMLGHERETLLDRPIVGVFKTGTGIALLNHIRQAATSEGRVIGEFSLQPQGGGPVRELRLDSNFHLRPDGQTRCLTTLIDISASKQLERERRLRQTELESILAAAPMGVGLVEERVFKWVSQRFLTMLGYGEQDLLGQSSRLIYPSASEYERVGREKYAQIRTDGVGEIETCFVRKDGSFLDVLLRSAALDPNDPGAGSIFTALDISERKHAEQALQRADRRKDEFLAILAHELRNPLAPIRNSVAVLKMRDLPDQVVQQAIGMIDGQSQHLVRLIDDLLDVNRISHGKLQIRLEPIELGGVLHQVAEAVRPDFDSAGQEFTLSLPSEAMILDADPVRLFQVFQNLLNNAGKYTGEGGSVHLIAERDASRVQIKVIDSGAGMTPEQLTHLFELFSQGGPPVGKAQQGLGIGLYLARSLVEMHGGEIEASSEGPGQGSQFLVSLPIRELTAVSKSAGSGRGDSLRRRILVVDDDPIVAMSNVMVLEQFGMDVQTVHEGLAAIEAVKGFRPEVVLLDIGLPDLVGYEVCRRIREVPGGQDMLIVAQTGWGQAEDRRKSMEAGFDAHFVKPVDPDELLALISKGKLDKQ